jgi:hypothetical protein
MLNLIPVVMLLLMQGGGQEMSLRQQQALLDLAQRVCTAQTLGELESDLANQGGAKASVWIKAFTHAVVPTETQTEATQEKNDCDWPSANDPRSTDPGWAESARQRDGPSGS